jgi:hypothetical protein
MLPQRLPTTKVLSISFDIASTLGEASSITGTYKSPASSTFTIERDSSGIWSVDDGIGGIP